VNKSDSVSIGGTINFPLSSRATPLGVERPHFKPQAGNTSPHPDKQGLRLRKLSFGYCLAKMPTTGRIA
jgi:hypothetical protein